MTENIRRTIAKALFVACYVARHHERPDTLYTTLIVNETWQEPVSNMPGNAWRWAE